MEATRNRMREQRELSSEEEGDLRRGPWTVEEDLLLVNYIAAHGEGRWNALARCAGLRRTGKSCRLRWLNYLRPDLRRGSMTAQEQLLILELHSRWGNRWSKIAQHLPGRTDNEIKNYWRTRVQKHAKNLNCDVNSQRFKDLMRYLWMPRLLERIHSAAADAHLAASPPPPVPAPYEYGCTSAAAAMCDHTGTALCQQPPLSSLSSDSSACLISAQQQPPLSQLAADACSWSESDQSLPGLAGQWYADMGALPDIDIAGLGVGAGDTTSWDAGDGDDLWFAQMLGL